MKYTTFVRIGLCVFLLSNFLIIVTGCTKSPTPSETPQDVAEYVPDPTPADNLSELINNLSSDDPRVRVVSAHALEEFGNEAAIAVPALLDNLDYTGVSDVRRSAIEALGKIGPDASESVPKLLSILQLESEAYKVRFSAIVALGEIGNKTAIPVLVSLLYKDDEIAKELAPISAMSIAKITGERFTDSDDYGFSSNEEGELLIVIDARKWWEEKGQYMEW